MAGLDDWSNLDFASLSADGITEALLDATASQIESIDINVLNDFDVGQIESILDKLTTLQFENLSLDKITGLTTDDLLSLASENLDAILSSVSSDQLHGILGSLT